MKKIISIFLLSIIFILSACDEGNNIDDIQKDFNYINTKVHFFEYKLATPKLRDHLSDYVVMNNLLDDFMYSDNILVIAFNLNSYPQLEADEVEFLFSLLNSNYKALILFVDATDYEFMRDTSMAFEKDLYDNQGEYIKAYYNFDARVDGIIEEDYYFSYDGNQKYTDGIITFTALKVREFYAAE